MRKTMVVGLGAGIIGALSACSSSSNHGNGGALDDAHRDTGSGTEDAGVARPDGGHLLDAGKEIDGSITRTDATTVEGGHGADGGQTSEGGVPGKDGGDAALLGPERLLVTFGGAATSEVVAVDVGTKAVDGRLQFAGSGITNVQTSAAPFLLEQNADIVTRLDTAKPWMVDAAWQVGMTDAIDGGSTYSDAVEVIPVGSQAYVLRYARNDVAIVNDVATNDGGPPMSSVDLSSLVQTADPDGVVDMTAAVYVASAKRLYVLLGNVNQIAAAQYGGVICGTTVSTLTAIDTTTNAVVDLGGTGPKGSVALTYVNPMSLVYDSVGGRLIAVSAGCYAQPTAGGSIGSSASHGGVEALDLTTFKSTSLLSISASSFPGTFVPPPSGFVYIDATHAVIGFDSAGATVYSWNPTTTSLGSVIPNAPDVFTYDGQGNLLGTRVDVTDAGVSTTHVVSVSIANGTSTTLASNVTSLTGDTYVASVDVWPHP